MTTISEGESHPKDYLLRKDRLPHIWCPTCGIGTAMSCFVTAVEDTGISMDKFAVVSGIGCTGRVAGYVNLDSFHTTHGRAIPFGVGLHLAKPDMKVVVISGDGDLISIGGNHFLHTARRNLDITIICVNNFIYGMTGGQLAPTTPQTAKTTTSPYGNFEYPMNIPFLAAACGAVYVARWTVLHIKRLTRAMKEAILKPGFSVVEVIAPCSTLYARRNRLGTGTELMKFYHDNCEIQHGASPESLDINFQNKIICGKFLDIEKPTFRDILEKKREEVLSK
ncbi:thiamine pyrophosphate-dependent enzyme [Bacteroidota bacterium]